MTIIYPKVHIVKGSSSLFLSSFQTFLTIFAVYRWAADCRPYTSITTLPKTQAGKRIIPLTPQLRQLLEEQRIIQLRERLKAGNAWTGGNAGKDSAFIFANRIGNPSDRHNLNRVYRGILKKIGLSSRGVHTLRHTFATNWIQQNPDIVALARVLGHSDPSFTYRTYCHADQRSINQGMTMMEAFFANVK